MSVCGIAMLVNSGATMAQSDDTEAAETDSADQGELEDIVVTARRVGERLQSVPVAVTAISGDTLEERNITSVNDLRLVTPSLNIAPTGAGGSNAPAVALRGQAQSRGLFGQDPSVAIYVNEVPQTRPLGIDTTNYDLQSVQVLKGPQGTLFGRNTTGGAILFTPNKPVNRLEGSVSMLYGSYDWLQGTAMLNIPASDSIAFRVAGNFLKRDGYVRNLINGQRLNDRDSQSFRAQMLFHQDGWENLTVVDGFFSDTNGMIGHITSIRPGQYNTFSGGAALASFQRVAARGTIYVVEGNYVSSDYARSVGISNVTTISLSDELTLKNIAGYRKVKTVFDSDYDYTSAKIIEGFTTMTEQWGSEELQLQGKWDKFSFIAGAFYYGESGTGGGATAALQPAGTDQKSSTGGRGKNRSVSIFAQGDIEILPTLTLTAGGRFTWDRREITAETRLVRTIPTPLVTCRVEDATGTPLPANACARTVAAKFREPTYNVSVNWTPTDNVLLYLAHRRGYRSGGFNMRAQRNLDVSTPFNPEIVKDIELGFKADWNIGPVKVRTNLALYHQNYENIQRNVNVIYNNLLTTTVFNAASARIRGGEFEFTIIPFRNFSLSGFGSITDPKYKTFIEPGTGRDLSSNRFALIPKYQGSLTAAYDIPLSDGGEIKLSGSIYSQSSFQSADINTATSTIDGYTLVDARIDWKRPFGTDFRVSAFVKNLTDKEYAVSGNSVDSTGYTYIFPGLPRMWGVQLGYEF